MKKFSIAVGIIIAAYILHVPILKLVSKSSLRASLSAYVPVSEHMESDAFEMIRLVEGTVWDVFLDPETRDFILIGDDSSGRFIRVFDQNAELITNTNFGFNDLNPYANNPNFVEIPKRIERQYSSQYRFRDQDGVVTLDHYQFEEFTYPYVSFFIPVIPFDWKGTAFVSVNAGEDTIKFHLPTDLVSKLVYFDASIDGQIFTYNTDGLPTDLMFIDIDESYYLAGSDGEIHRDGWGFYVVKPK